jgi:type I restriction enzyme M protein
MSNANGSNLGFEERLWTAADALRGSMDSSDYKHVVLGLIFLKYISDAFIEKFQQLQTEKFADPEDQDEYLADNIFWVPPEARWDFLQANAKDPEIGILIDKAMIAIERDNPQLKAILPKDFARPSLNKFKLGQLIDLIGSIELGNAESRDKDVLGRVYEYFLGKFAASEGKGGGEFYTPQCIVRLLVEMLEPYHGRVYDPCCGSGGMFVQATRFMEAHANGNGNGNGKKSSVPHPKQDISIFGQEGNPTTHKLCVMNLAIRGIESQQVVWGDTFLEPKHMDKRFDFILANPPFNMDNWGFSQTDNDVRWHYGSPPQGGERKQPDGSVLHVDGGNANFAWIQHFIHHLKPQGTAGFVMANGSMSTSTTHELAIRQGIIEDDLVDCMIALPGQLFYSTQIPVCLWFLTKSKTADPQRGIRDRKGETLFIDARQMGALVDRTHRELSGEDIAQIAATYHHWRSETQNGSYQDQPGYCSAATMDDIRQNNYVLTPGRYVGVADVEDDGEPFEDKMARLTVKLYEQMREGQALDDRIRTNLEALGYGE